MRLRRFFQHLEDIRKNDRQIFGPKLMLEYGHSKCEKLSREGASRHMALLESSCNGNINYHSQRLIFEIVSLLPY